MPRMQAFQLSLFADYFQFYLQDETVSGDLSDAWSAEATARLLASAPGTVGIGTVRNMDVPVTIEIHSDQPPDDQADWDHVVEASMDIQSGQIVVAGCTDYFPDAQRIAVTPATYSVRVSYGALDSLSEDGLSGNDHYRVQLWPSCLVDTKVIKQRPARQPG